MYTCIIKINIGKELFNPFDAVICHFKQNISIMLVARERKKKYLPTIFYVYHKTEL